MVFLFSKNSEKLLASRFLFHNVSVQKINLFWLFYELLGTFLIRYAFIFICLNYVFFPVYVWKIPSDTLYMRFHYWIKIDRFFFHFLEIPMFRCKISFLYFWNKKKIAVQLYIPFFRNLSRRRSSEIRFIETFFCKCLILLNGLPQFFIVQSFTKVKYFAVFFVTILNLSFSRIWIQMKLNIFNKGSGITRNKSLQWRFVSRKFYWYIRTITLYYMEISFYCWFLWIE